MASHFIVANSTDSLSSTDDDAVNIIVGVTMGVVVFIVMMAAVMMHIYRKQIRGWNPHMGGALYSWTASSDWSSGDSIRLM